MLRKRSVYLLILIISVQFFNSSAKAESVKNAYDNFLKAQKSGNVEYYWSSLDSLARTLKKNGRPSEAFDLMDLSLDYRQSISSKESLAQDRIVTRIALYSLLPVLVAFSFFIFVFYRNRRELVFRRREAEVEMKALRSQMNPHFIFNCMNSIYKFLNDNDSKQAGDYLLRFSKLIRAVLENSNHKEVTMADDLMALELYIQMEQLRMQQRFDYRIDISDGLDQEAIYIPPLILQPFVENAIWHGLNNRPDKGLLQIKVEHIGEHIRYGILDNGRPSPPENQAKDDLSGKIKKTSMGSTLTRERIDLLNRTKGVNARFEETILSDDKGEYAGRRIDIFLPYVSE